MAIDCHPEETACSLNSERSSKVVWSTDLVSRPRPVASNLFRNWVDLLHSKELPSAVTQYSILSVSIGGVPRSSALMLVAEDDAPEIDEEAPGAKKNWIKRDARLVRRMASPSLEVAGWFGVGRHNYPASKLKITETTESLIRQWIRITSNVDGNVTRHCDGWDGEDLSRLGSGSLVTDKFKTATGKDAGFLTWKDGKKNKRIPAKHDKPSFHHSWVEQLGRLKATGSASSVRILYEFLTLHCERRYNKSSKTWSDWKTVSYEMWWAYFTFELERGQIVRRKGDKKKGTSATPTRSSGKGEPPSSVTGKNGMNLDSTLHDDKVKEKDEDSDAAVLTIDCDSD